MNKATRGFTLIELLLSALIIGILTSVVLVVINPAQVRAKARDTQRISDLKTIQTALEQFYLARRAYPSSKNNGAAATQTDLSIFTVITNVSGVTGDHLSQCLLGSSNCASNYPPAVLSAVPLDPSGTTTNDTNPCTGPAAYRYWAPAKSNSGTDNNYASRYILTATMEVASSASESPCTTANLENWGSSGWCSSTTCYGLENE